MIARRLSSQSARWLNTVFALVAMLFSPLRSHCSGTAAEQEFITRNWDIEEGLPASNVSALARTPDGFLWIGTPSGLVRYDGAHFKTFSPANTPALSDPRIASLFVDHSGTLWIGTGDGGLARFITNTFQAFSLGASIPKADLRGFAEDRDGTVWGIVGREGVFSWRNGQASFYSTNSGLTSSIIWEIAADAQGQVWVNCRGRLMQYRAGRWKDAEGLPRNFPHIYAIGPARNGGLWLGCDRRSSPPIGEDRGVRIFKYENSKVIEGAALPCNQDSRRSLPRVLMEDQQGRVWCATHGAGIFFQHGNEWQLFSEAPSLSQVQATCLTEDEDSVIWFGMDGAGLYQVRQRTVVALEPPPGIPSTCFWTVCSSHDGAIWGGTDGNGIFRWKDGLTTHFQSEQGLPDEHVNAILEDRESKIWAGTMSGLFRLNGARFEPMNGVDALRLPVFSLKEDRAGHIWAGTHNGLVQIGHGMTNVFGQEQGIPLGDINAIEEDDRGRIWVSIPPYHDRRGPDPVYPYGLFVQSGKHFEHVGAGQWAGEFNIRSLYADADGNLWIGTIGTGFYRLRDGKFTEFSLDDGVPHNRIQAIIADDARNLWFCSESGIFGCPIEQLESYTRGPNARLNWWQIQHSDGLPSRLATGNGQPSAARGADGRLWLANANAIAGFNPKALRENARLQPPIIEEVLVNGVTQPLAGNSRLRITGDMRRVEICYTSPNTTTPDLPTFWTRLKAFDPNWVRGGIARVASYNLQPGDYEFAVAVTGPDGSILETASPLEIEVVPQFLERLSVRLMAGFLFMAGITLGVWRWERARSEQRLRQLEIQRALDQVRQRIARDIHDDLGSGLTEITLLSDNLTSDGNDAQANIQTVRRIGDCARALTHEMDEVVWAINPRTDTLESLATYLNDFAQERLALAGIRCRLNTSAELPNLHLSADIRHSLFRAAKEALNNAIKYSGASEVVVTIESRANDLLLLIQDNGCGFDPLRQLKRGNGLKNMRQRLEEIGGRCDLVSKPGAGTSVCFSIPGVADRVYHPSPNGHPTPS
jgi:signal transduction histidine kinase/ligand-binding sensor domain-containing protein